MEKRSDCFVSNDVTLCIKCRTASTRKCGKHDVVVDCNCGAIAEKVMTFVDRLSLGELRTYLRAINRQVRVMERTS